MESFFHQFAPKRMVNYPTQFMKNQKIRE
jgi:hypothetical protein